MMVAPTTGGLRGELYRDEPMSRHTSWRVGGPARTYYRPADLEDLAGFLSSLPADEYLVWLGLGSNLLVRDGGIPGTVIATFGVLGELSLLDETLLRAEAGVACAKVARFSANHGLVGGEFLAGIPGSVGGALAMNAGAFGGETWDYIRAVETIDRVGIRRIREPGEFQVGYRQVKGPQGEWFIAARFEFERGNTAAALERISALLAQRGATQPTRQPSCGSVFRNPPGDYAARLIEACGLKGSCIGAACVSDKHANFIVNTGGARAADIEALIAHVRDEVERVHGVSLRTEVRIVGRSGGERR
jgi:UDP-N-acetylmuramate dehydrogenase